MFCDSGEVVHVHTASGQLLGTAYMNPHSLICARLVSRSPEAALDVEFFEKRFQSALALRRMVLGDQARYCRLVHGEGDSLSGLVVDVFGDHAVIQTHTAGMDMRREAIIAALTTVLKPAVIIERADAGAREDGLESRVAVVLGRSDGLATVRENGIELKVDLLHGQKTGFFYDQRPTRAVVQQLVFQQTDRKPRLLDLFCYSGAFGVAAAKVGARVVGVDSSLPALELAKLNSNRNELSGSAEWKHGEVEQILSEMLTQREEFDVVICDPPAYVKSNTKKFSGLRKLRAMNEQAMLVTRKGGLFVACSCDYHVSPVEFDAILAEAAERVGRVGQIVWRGGAGADHPVPLGHPECDYLCCVVMRLE
eukprot:TRINITY_DN717_c0_g1_i3.p1 TRINITY_DN717_c0_g1~~TRINITY_DN717_c0_g1_i3.p1  ORF type:complete len:366 (-),score=57.67 TRINITY_DN717_c0_g1_i3:16-1113(-)